MSNYKGYFLKSLGLKEDSLPGGKGDEKQPDEVNQKQLEMGIKVEMEHTQDPDLAKEIAMDHLSEDPQYYSHLKDAGMADELPEGTNGEIKPMLPMMSKLFSPTAIKTPVIAVGVRGTKTGLLPAGGIVDDPEKARLGGLELVKNLKPNSQGAIANTPSSKDIQADGGHFTPDNKEITKGKSPTTNVKGDDSIHPMQVQQLGNKPFEDDGTTRDGEHTPPAAGGDGDANGGDKRCKDAKPAAQVASDDQDFSPDEKDSEEKPKGPWGIELDGEKDEEGDEEEGEDVSIDIKESKGQICFHCKKPRPCQCDKKDKKDSEASDPESPKYDWKRFGGSNKPPTDFKEATGEVSAPVSDVAGWEDLLELTNAAKFNTSAGSMDMWALMGLEGLSMRDSEQQTPRFFDFILRHKNETIQYHAAHGEKIQFADNQTLKQGWLQSKKKKTDYAKQEKNKPKPCKVCGQTFTPSKGEGICPKCVTKTNEASTFDSSIRNRFQELANIPKEARDPNADRDPGDGDDWQIGSPDMAAHQASFDTGRKHYKGSNDWEEDERLQLGTNEAGALSELKQVVDRMKAKGKTSPSLVKAEKILAERYKK